MASVEDSKAIARTRTSNQWLWWTTAIFSLTVVMAALPLGTPAQEAAFGFLAQALSAGGVVVAARHVASAEHPLTANRRLWKIMSWAIVGMALGALAAGLHALTTGRSSILLPPSAAALLVVSHVVLTYAFISFPTAARTRRERTTIWLDAATVMAAVGAFLWLMSAGMQSHGETSSIGSSSSGHDNVAHTVMLFVLSSAVVKTLFANVTTMSRRAGALFLPGVLILGAAETFAPMLDGSEAAPWIFAMKTLACVVFALAMKTEHQSLAGANCIADHQRYRKRHFSFLPYVAIAGTFGLVALEMRHSGTDGAWVALTAVALSTMLVISRQVMAFLDNARLLERLDANYVELRTAYESEQKARAEKDAMEVQLRHAQKLEAVGRLAGGLAHEINTPMQFVRDNLRFVGSTVEDLALTVTLYEKALDAGPSDQAERLDAAKEQRANADLDFLLPEIKGALHDSEQGLARVTTLVQSMKTFGEAEAKTRRPLDLNECLEQTVSVSSGEWSSIATMSCDFGEIPTVVGIAGDLNQVWLNIIVNAIHAVEDRFGRDSGLGEIRIATEAVNGRVRITVSDNGGGVPEESKHRIFDPFFTTKVVGRGAGIGLSVAYQVIVDAHGGSIDFESSADGTTFRIELPLEDDEAAH